MALINKLNNIGDAIRAKTGKEDKLTLEQMVTEIAAIETGGSEPAVIEALEVTVNGTYTPSEGVDGFNPVTVNVPSGGGDVPEKAFVITDNCSYRFAYNGWNWFIENYGNQISTKNITIGNYIFQHSSSLKEIPFEINFSPSSYSVGVSLFEGCSKLKAVPKMNNAMPSATNNIFKDCQNIREIPLECFNTWDWSFLEEKTSPYSGDRSSQFYGCYSLRSIPKDFLHHINQYTVNSYSIYYNGFSKCYTLDEIVEMPIYTMATWTSNAFMSTFNQCFRLKNVTFATQEDGTPYVVNWKYQTIDLATQNVGYLPSTGYNYTITDYNSGITGDKYVYDDATYQALKDDPDWYTSYISPDAPYCRYNHDSAVATINSLPDTSAYLASAGGTNTIKFKGYCGGKTDGGAINTLTAEEIAVATAKGWTVSFT